MNFTEATLPGVWLVEPERLDDERGFFARTWDTEEFALRGLTPRLAQCSISFNRRRGTLRGLHYQVAPHEEAKLVRCAAGAIFDVALDIRFGSPTFGAWFGAELTAHNRLALYVPEGCAHGYLTLADDTEVVYQTSAFYEPSAERGAHHADPAFAIGWPIDVAVISDKDAAWPLLGSRREA